MSDLESVTNAAEDLVATISLEVNHPNTKLILIVEGVDDTKIYKKLFKDDFSIYSFKNGCEDVKKIVLETFVSEKKVIGIVDSDFYHNLSGGYPLLQKLFMTDFHDVEMTIIKDKKTFRKILVEHNIKKDENQFKTEVFSFLKYFSLLKYYNEYFGKGLRISKELIDYKEIDLFINECIARNNGKNLNQAKTHTITYGHIMEKNNTIIL